MGLFGRKKTLNERLLEEAQVESAPREAPEPPEPPKPLYPKPAVPPRWWTGGLEAALAGAYPPEWQVWATAEAPEIAGDEVEFFALPDGSLVVDVEEGDAELDPLARAVEAQLAPPYRAKGRRESDRIWSVWANPAQIAELHADGEEITLTLVDGERTVIVDDQPAAVDLPELERLGEQEGSDYVVRATRLDGQIWEVQTAAL